MGYGRGGGRKEYDNNMRGVLFENDRKRRGKEDPDMQGRCEIDGVEYWLNAWWKQGQKGDFLSISLKLKEEDNGRNQNAGRGRSAGPSGGRGRADDRGYSRDDDRRGNGRGEARGGNSNDDPDDDLEDIPF